MSEQTTTEQPSGAGALELAAAVGETLFHTPGGTKLHIRACMHFAPDSEVHEATPGTAQGRSLCVACAAELAGHGRTYFDDLETAMAALPLPVTSVAHVRELVHGIRPGTIWIPYSRSYVALGGADMATVYVGKTYVWLDGRTIPLPGYAPGGGSSSADAAGRGSPTCPQCGYQMPRTGVCEYH